MPATQASLIKFNMLHNSCIKFICCHFFQAVELLLASRDVKSALTNGKTYKTDPPLHLACKTGHLEIVRLELKLIKAILCFSFL